MKYNTYYDEKQNLYPKFEYIIQILIPNFFFFVKKKHHNYNLFENIFEIKLYIRVQQNKLYFFKINSKILLR